MQALVTKHGGEVPQQLLRRIVEEVVLLISDTDLVVAAMSLRLCATLLTQQPSSAASISASALPPAMALLQSQLIQARLHTQRSSGSTCCSCCCQACNRLTAIHPPQQSHACQLNIRIDHMRLLVSGASASHYISLASNDAAACVCIWCVPQEAFHLHLLHCRERLWMH